MVKRKFREFQGVVLEEDISEGGPKKGTFGIVLDLLADNGLAVEFFAENGATIEVLLIFDSQVRPATLKEEHSALDAQERLPISFENV